MKIKMKFGKNLGKNSGRIVKKNSLVSKVIAFVLVIGMTIAAGGCVASFFLMKEEGIYTRGKSQHLEDGITERLKIDAEYFRKQVVNLEENNVSLIEYCEKRNYESVYIWKDTYDESAWSWSRKNAQVGQTLIVNWAANGKVSYNEYGVPGKFITVQITLNKQPTLMKDEYRDFYYGIHGLYAWRILVFPAFVLALAVAIGSMIYLMKSAGHCPEDNLIHTGWHTKIPLDLLTIMAGICIWLVNYGYHRFYFSLNGMEFYHSPESLVYMYLHTPGKIFEILAFAIMESIILGWCISLVVRIKKGKCMEHTIIGRLPLIWKTILLFVCITMLEVVPFCSTRLTTEQTLGFWIVAKVIFLAILLYVTIILGKFQKVGKNLASGDLSYTVNTKFLLWDLAKYGECLNEIKNSVSCAVEARMKSERMKTELITNVTHDIKTPLTSIVNYIGLLEQEPCENERIKEYVEILAKHANRLKHLIEDLVEVSKARTGNLDLNLELCDASILLTQAVGEYQQKMEAAGLQLVAKEPDHPVYIMAEGRRLWRVFDNLLNNICKYAQNGTRVYLTLQEKDNIVEIVFKNVARDMLNVSVDELMERFVRGDHSRSSEGNGLGLSIAKSLVELQKGQMDVEIDGDLFKVILRFCVVKD